MVALLRQPIENETQLFSRDYKALPIESLDDCLKDLPRDAITKPAKQLQELQLVRRSQTGDADAFAELVAKYVERPDSVQHEPVFAGPVKELVTGPCVSQPGVPVPDRGREEFNIGIGSPGAGCGNQVGDPGRS